MPEGHTIHRLARDHDRLFRGRPLRASSPQGRFEAGAALLDGRALERLDPWGKHLLYGFEADLWLHVHLGLYGKWASGPLPAPAPRGALRLRLESGNAYADLRGPTACEIVTPPQVDALFARLGPDPLRRDAEPERAWSRVSRSRSAIGVLLMDQSVVAGVGNVYRAEVLYRAGLSPYRPGRDIGRATWEALWVDTVTLLRAGVRAGRIVTTRPEHRSRRSGRPTRADSHYVYRRAGLPCRVCGTPVQAAVMVARNLFWCPYCQPA